MTTVTANFEKSVTLLCTMVLNVKGIEYFGYRDTPGRVIFQKILRK
jgi:hypothetical protein